MDSEQAVGMTFNTKAGEYLVELEGKLEALEVEAKKYLRNGHDDDCRALWSNPQPCDCGYDELAKLLEGGKDG